jgi:hypothetical protein
VLGSGVLGCSFQVFKFSISFFLFFCYKAKNISFEF